MAFDPDAYLAQKSGGQAGAAPGFDPDAYLQAKTVAVKPTEAAAPESSMLDKLKDYAARGARHIPILGTAFNPAVQDAAMRGLDYAAGGIRTGIAGAAGIADKEDLLRTLKGKAPRTSEYLAKGGVPEGPSIYGLNTRGAVGLAGDVLTDPLTYVSPGKVLGEFGQATRTAGEDLYRSGLKSLDIENAKYGRGPVSDVIVNNRITGNKRQISTKMDKLAHVRKTEVDDILSKASEAGATTSSGESLAHADDFINKLRSTRDPRLTPLLDKMDEEVGTLWGVESPTPTQMNAMKRNTYSVIGDAGYDQARSTPAWKQFQKEVARGQRQEIERSVGEALGADAGQTLATKNDELGRLLTSRERAQRDAAIYERKNAFTPIDALGVGHALENGHGIAWAIPGLKKAADIAKEADFRTNVGLGMMDLGQTRIPDVLVRRALIDQNNPWAGVK